MEKWEIARTSGVCSRTGRPLEEGEEYYVVLFEEGETFRRADCALSAWTGPPEGAFCHFKSRIPLRKPKKRLLVDDDLLINFFVRLAEETDESRLRFRFVLGLILMRKRLLRYETTLRDGEHEQWRMRLMRDQSLHQVMNPQLTDGQIEDVSRQIGAILHGDAGTFAEQEGWTDDTAPPEEAADA